MPTLRPRRLQSGEQGAEERGWRNDLTMHAVAAGTPARRRQFGGPAVQATYSLARSTVERPDDLGGAQVKIIYAVNWESPCHDQIPVLRRGDKQ